MNPNGNMSDYQRTCDSFRINVPEFFNFGIDVVDKWASIEPQKRAMVWVDQQGKDKTFSFGEISKQSSRMANLLTAAGVKPFNRILLLLPRVPEWWIATVAIIKTGALHCPAPVMLTEYDLKNRIHAGEFDGIITDQENAGKIDDIVAECPSLKYRIIIDGPRPGWIDYQSEMERQKETFLPQYRTKSSDPLVIYFTSGTNNVDPKMVLHSHALPLGHEVTARFWHDLAENDLHFSLSDTGWAKCAWGKLFGQWLLGAAVFVYDIRGKFHAEELLPLIPKYGINVFCAPPTVYRMLVQNDLTRYDFSSLKRCCSAGEPINKETIRLWQKATGHKIYEGYGQTESVLMIATFPNMEYKAGAMGRPSPGWQVEIHNDNGEPSEPHAVGRIAVRMNPRPVGMFERYLGHESLNSEVFIGDYYYTGDKAFCDEDGYFWYVGRSDDVIKSSGYRIGPLEVENAIMEHPAVKETAVIGVPDEIRGAVIKAYVVLNNGFIPSEKLKEEIQNTVKNLTAPYKYPRIIDFTDSLPKTISGKIRRNLLREQSQVERAEV